MKAILFLPAIFFLSFHLDAASDLNKPSKLNPPIELDDIFSSDDSIDSVELNQKITNMLERLRRGIQDSSLPKREPQEINQIKGPSLGGLDEDFEKEKESLPMILTNKGSKRYEHKNLLKNSETSQASSLVNNDGIERNQKDEPLNLKRSSQDGYDILSSGQVLLVEEDDDALPSTSSSGSIDIFRENVDDAPYSSQTIEKKSPGEKRFDTISSLFGDSSDNDSREKNRFDNGPSNNEIDGKDLSDRALTNPLASPSQDEKNVLERLPQKASTLATASLTMNNDKGNDLEELSQVASNSLAMNQVNLILWVWCLFIIVLLIVTR